MCVKNGADCRGVTSSGPRRLGNRSTPSGAASESPPRRARSTRRTTRSGAVPSRLATWSVIARNSLGCDSDQCGNCMFGCRVGGKQSAANTYLVDAIRSGARLMAPFSALRLVQEKGKVVGVEGIARDTDGAIRQVKITTTRVVLAAGALESPALLMRSGLESPHLGRHLYLHPTVAVTAQYSSPMEAWAGPPQTVVCDEFSALAKGYGDRIDAAPTYPGLSAVGGPWSSGRHTRREMQQVRFAA